MAPLYSLTEDGFKYIRAPKPELYDVRSDPHELTNLFASAAEKASALDLHLQQLMEGWQAHALQSAENPIAKETLESLHALGYVAGPEEKQAMGGMDPKDGLPLYNKLEEARHLAQRGKWEDARKALEALVAEMPNNVSALNILALACIREQKFPDAKAWYEKSLAVDPQQFRIYGMLGGIEMRRGKLDEAKAHFLKGLELSPSFVEAMNNLGFIEAIRDNPAGAKEWYDKATAVDPAFPLANRRMGDLYYETGDYTNALTYYERSLQALSNDFESVIQAASSARHLGDMKKAEHYLAYAETLRDDSWIPLYNLACLKAVTGQTNEVMPLLQRSMAAGFRFPGQLLKDNDLVAYRARPDFTNLYQAAVRNYNEHRARREADEEESGEN
jgi:Tfp pilus assembly protein PilF